MGQAVLSAQRVIVASAKAIDFIASRRGTNDAVAHGKIVQEMLQKLRALAMCAVAEGGGDAVVTVNSEEAVWLVGHYESFGAWGRPPSADDGALNSGLPSKPSPTKIQEEIPSPPGGCEPPVSAHQRSYDTGDH